MRKILFPILVLIVPLTFGVPAPAEVIRTIPSSIPSVGKISIYEGKAFITNPFGQTKKIKKSSTLFPGEILKTAEKSYAEIRFSDGSVLNLGPKGGVKIENFTYDPNMDYGRMSIRILSGIYRFTSGRMRPQEKGAVRLRFPAGNASFTNATLLGQVFQKRSVIILWKSPLKTESFEPVYVQTKENDENYQKTIGKKGLGCITDDENFSPSPVFKVPDYDIAWLELQLVPAPVVAQQQKKVPEPEKPEIQAIVYDQEDPSQTKFVVIQGKLYKEKEIVLGYEVVSIEPKLAVLKNMLTGKIENLKVVSVSSKAVSAKQEAPPIVESIFYDRKNHKNSFVYVQNMLYREGASFREFTILQILQDRIKVRNSHTKRIVFLKLQAAGKERKKGETPLILQSISYNHEDPAQSIAALNGALYHEGEAWENYQIEKIFSDHVYLRDKKTKRLRKITTTQAPKPTDTKPEITIQIILYNDQEREKSQVAIEGKLYKSGDLVEGYEILDIQKHDIRVRKKGNLNWETHIIRNKSRKS